MDPSYNNSFSSSNQAPISSGTGDIILASSGEKSSRKGLVIGLIVFIVLTVVAAVLAVIFLGGGIKIADVRTEFNKLANYTLFGEESDNNINLNEVYTDELAYDVTGMLIEETPEQKEEKTAYYAKLNELKNAFIEKYNSDGAEKDEYEALVVQNIDQIVSFLYEYSKFSDPSVEDYAGLYGKNDEYLEQYINNYYKVFTESENEYSQEYGAIKTEVLRTGAPILAKHNLFGACMVGEVNPEECAKVTSGVSAEEIAVLNKGDEYTADANAMVERDTGRLSHYIVEFTKIMNGEGQE